MRRHAAWPLTPCPRSASSISSVLLSAEDILWEWHKLQKKRKHGEELKNKTVFLKHTWHFNEELWSLLFLQNLYLFSPHCLTRHSTPQHSERMTEWAGDWRFLIELQPTNGVNQGAGWKNSFSDRCVSKIVRPPWQQIHSTKKKRRKSVGGRRGETSGGVKEDWEPWQSVKQESSEWIPSQSEHLPFSCP